MTKQKLVLITGASSGIEYQAEETLSTPGFKVYGAAWQTEKMSPLSSLGITPLKMDLTDEHSIKSAGYGAYGAIENGPIEKAK